MAKKKTFRDYTSVGRLSADYFINNLAFFLFISFLGIIFIANAHYAERKKKEILKAEQTLKQLRWHYEDTRANFEKENKKWRITRDAKQMGLKEKSNGQNIIVVPQNKEY